MQHRYVAAHERLRGRQERPHPSGRAGVHSTAPQPSPADSELFQDSVHAPQGIGRGALASDSDTFRAGVPRPDVQQSTRALLRTLRATANAASRWGHARCFLHSGQIWSASSGAPGSGPGSGGIPTDSGANARPQTVCTNRLDGLKVPRCVPPSARDSTNQRNTRPPFTECDPSVTVCVCRAVCRVFLTSSNLRSRGHPSSSGQ